MIDRSTRNPTAVRIGAVNYLNSKPLVHGLVERLPEAELRFDLPSRLAESLAAGWFDVALIPSVEMLRESNYRIVSDACVASDGSVMSVKLYFRTPPGRVRTLALDEGSRTSAALAQVLLAERHGVRPSLSALPIGCGAEAANADAVLVIGDRAMLPSQESFIDEWDLGAEWRDWTGLPFVFACWAARAGVVTGELAAVLSATRDAGVAAVRDIAQAEAPLLGLEAGLAERYLTRSLHFQLGRRERAALDRFSGCCRSIGLLAAAVR